MTEADEPTAPLPKRGARRRLSPLRVVVAAGLLAGGGVAGSQAARQALADEPALPAPWFAPYVDVTLPPFHPFEDRAVNPADDVVLGFVVAGTDRCTPTWGAAFDLDEAATSMDLDRRIERYRNLGGEVVVSFGGAANRELAVACRDVEDLVDAYGRVVERYAVSTIDFDIEGPALADGAANQRRAEAVRTLQDRAAGDGERLAVWLTLPVAPSGMLPDAMAVVDAMLVEGVDLAGVNLMTMNYGQGRGTSTMWEATDAALDAAHDQLGRAYRRVGLRLSGDQLWRKLGATPMVGHNDVAGEVFTLDDVEALVGRARQVGLGRLGLWSSNRDRPCGPNIDPRVVSNHCSGVDQEPSAFVTAMDRLPGRSAQASRTDTPVVTVPDPVDDPATSPYPIWDERRVYEEGAKVVWRRQVYQAKWWSQGEVPDTPVVNEWDTPWRLVGPVLPGDRPAPTTTIAPGLLPAWSGTATYEGGDRVERRGAPYEAKWWTQGDDPLRESDLTYTSPWEPLTAEDVAGEGRSQPGSGVS